MLFETLETRRLMSASPAQIAADRAQTHSDFLAITASEAAYSATLVADTAAMAADGLASDPTLTPLFTTLHTDTANMQTMIGDAVATTTSAVLADQSALAAEQLKVIQDAGNPTQVTADHAQVVTDRIKIQNDEITGLNSLLTIRDSENTTLIFTDLNAIGVALHTDTHASSALKSDVVKFANDRTAALNNFASGLETLITDHTKLVTDLS